jgi:NAD(P)-dependent dehydrogenase (short-subunit alcohol dehydrogenase family)
MVTGAAGGIGRSTAKAFAELGADVALMDIPSSKEKLEAICTEIQEKYGVKAIAVLGAYQTK